MLCNIVCNENVLFTTTNSYVDESNKHSAQRKTSFKNRQSLCSISMRMMISLWLKGIRNGYKAEGELHRVDHGFFFIDLDDYYKGVFIL